ncbi:diguanylate cyclase (GGDEF) domain-containing protein [Malonomonas rubra DSM 5091]|uniref:Diguanylate cyclase (GGDEF) domain-containing protein n=1 Tax=Malonomonas rubra DSM 5091 TaxID=1122189 RepID=A0A1M6K911_MALRU|nr:EAL domain-containing response regulator [Malonomonas rubra]SHJ55347.1 diguanylate cyclase (GGDEF) domain-containing protein [Malonomonas rubra DSM 5091]
MVTNFINDGFKHHLSAKVLVIDDVALNLSIIEDMLRDNGYSNVIALQDPLQAYDVIESERPELILLDLVMPEVSGFDILSHLRNHPKFKYLPVIILTASDEDENKLKALELGATDYLSKPLDTLELCMRVRNILYSKAYQNQLAYYDTLTQLPNKQMFLDDLAWVLKSASRHDDKLALLNIEIDNFDSINNTVGLNAGDAVLRLVTARIQNVIRDSDLLVHLVDKQDAEIKLFHLERNVFSLLLTRVPSAESVVQIARRINSEIEATMHVEGNDYYVSASIGIAVYPDEAEDLSELMRLAGSAKDFVKRQGGNSFQFSSKEINEKYEKRLQLDASLRQGLTNEEFLLYYQPKVDLGTGRVTGAEALIRWQPNGELIFPDKFLPHAEETGLIVPIGNWCLKEACKQLREWHQHGNRINLAVNLSAKQLGDKDFLPFVQSIIAETGVDSNYLTFELTESFLISDVERKIELFGKLRELGIKLSIDDFGTGYSSLSYLRRIPLDELKIDRSFIMEVSQNNNSRAIVSTIIYLAKSLNLSTVAEGVELHSERDFLQQLDCTQFQGFLFSKAVPAEQLSMLLQKNH